MSYEDDKYNTDGVSGQRVAKRLAEISKIGQTNEGGSKRLGFSPEERAAKELIKVWMGQAGLRVREDGAGNVFGRINGKTDNGSLILSGSHVDTVPNGGHFDGVLGVLAALEVVEAWREMGYTPTKTYEVVIFSDEEGSRFNSGYIGSKAMTGKYQLSELLKQKDQSDKSFEEVLRSDNLTIEGFKDAKRSLEDIEVYVEVHIEQGKILESEKLPCGIVSAIAGPIWFKITIEGNAGHAGSTPMSGRSDALVAAGKFIHELSKLPSKISNSAVATVGKMFVYPNGVNVIPEKVELFVDLRDVELYLRDNLVTAMKELLDSIQKECSIIVKDEELMNISPVKIQEKTQRTLVEVLQECGIKPVKLSSGAGHDAMIVGENIPVAMLFVQSKEGISHSPLEWSSLNDCMQTIHVLKKFIEKMM